MKQPSTEDLTAIRDQLREEVREAHGTLKDLRREIREARELVASTQSLATTLAAGHVKAAIEAAVTEQLATLGEAAEGQMRKSAEKVIAEFDKLRDLLLGNERAPDAREQRSIPELLQDPAVLAGVQQRLREAGRG